MSAALAVSGLSILMTLALQRAACSGAELRRPGATLVLLYGFSTLYHAVRAARRRRYCKIDHHAIYLLIARQPPPSRSLRLQGTWGWTLFGLVWALAVAGLLQEHFWGRHALKLSLLLYAPSWAGWW